MRLQGAEVPVRGSGVLGWGEDLFSDPFGPESDAWSREGQVPQWEQTGGFSCSPAWGLLPADRAARIMSGSLGLRSAQRPWHSCISQGLPFPLSAPSWVSFTPGLVG